MTAFLTIIHVLVCFSLIGIVLLQRGKGADMGAAFGGSSQTLFGSAGATTFLGKLTAVAAVLFMLTSIGLTLSQQSASGSSNSLIPEEPAASAPLAPPPAAPPVQK
jgi:preprotein translocase subunit SecG